MPSIARTPAPLEAAQPRSSEPLRLNIGCGRSPREGYLNCDLHGGAGVDYVFDATKKWPFLDGSVAEIYTSHTLEHLPDPLAFFREAWRVLIPNGQIVIRVPYGWHSSAWWDLTHLRPWLQESFATVQPGFSHFSRNNQETEETLGCAFWTGSVIMMLDQPFARWWRWRILRKPIMSCLRHLIGVCRELIATLYKVPLDDPQSIAFGGTKHPAVVPIQIGVWEHDLYGRKLKPGDESHLIVFWAKEKDPAFMEAIAGV